MGSIFLERERASATGGAPALALATRATTAKVHALTKAFPQSEHADLRDIRPRHSEIPGTPSSFGVFVAEPANPYKFSLNPKSLFNRVPNRDF
jgi:hypothetical protein